MNSPMEEPERPPGAEPADTEREGGSNQVERVDVDMEVELELARRRRAAHHAARQRAEGEELQRRYAAAAEFYGGVGSDRPPPNCPAQAVLVWMACQVLILMDIVRVPSNCVTLSGRDQCITCELGADLDYSECVLPWPGASEIAPSISFEMTATIDFYNECCTAHPDCCSPTGALPAHIPAVHEPADGYIKAMVRGEPCCDALCGAHGTEADMTVAELEALVVTEDFYCDGFTVWYLTFVGVYVASIAVVGNAARNDGSASACLALTLGIIILYWVRVRIVPYGTNRHTYIYPAVQFFEYAMMSDLFLWMMTRRARAMRLHYERTTRRMNLVEDLDLARLRDREELDRAAELLARRPIEPLPPVKPVEWAAVGAIVEGISIDDMGADGQVALSANPMMRAVVSVGHVVHQRELQQATRGGAGVVDSGYRDEEDGEIEPLPLRIAPSAVVIQPRSRTGTGVVSSTGAAGAPVLTVLARLTPPSSPSSASGAVVDGIADPSTRPRHAMAAVEDDSDDDVV